MKGRERGKGITVTRAEEAAQEFKRYWTTHTVRAPWYFRAHNLSVEEIVRITHGAVTLQQVWVRMRDHYRRLDLLDAGISAPRRVVKVRKMTTVEYRNRLRDLSGVEKGPTGRLKCWEAMLDAFGITKRTGRGEYSEVYRKYLEAEGWEVRQVKPLGPEGVTPTLAVFLAEHASSGNWIIETRGHVLAMRDGVITDTAGQSGTVAKVVTAAYEVIEKPKPREVGAINWPDPRCTCPHPLTWGHLDPQCPTGLGHWKQPYHHA